MKRSNGSPRPGRKFTSPKRQEQLLAAFDRSGLSAAAFARQHRIRYTTFCNWRHRRTKTAPGFVQVELPTPTAPVEVTVELGAQARIRIGSATQIELVVRLLQALNAPSPC